MNSGLASLWGKLLLRIESDATELLGGIPALAEYGGLIDALRRPAPEKDGKAVVA